MFKIQISSYNPIILKYEGRDPGKSFDSKAFNFWLSERIRHLVKEEKNRSSKRNSGSFARASLTIANDMLRNTTGLQRTGDNSIRTKIKI